MTFGLVICRCLLTLWSLAVIGMANAWGLPACASAQTWSHDLGAPSKKALLAGNERPGVPRSAGNASLGLPSGPSQRIAGNAYPMITRSQGSDLDQSGVLRAMMPIAPWATAVLAFS